MFDWAYWGYGSAFALIAWLPFGLWRFTRVRPALAATQVMIWGMMWLPEGAAFDLPALPPFSKYTISAVCVLLGFWWKAPERLRAARIGRGYDVLVWLMIMAQIGTVLTNSDALHYGTWKTIDIPGFTPYDGISAAVRVLLTVGLPFVLGRALLRSERDLQDLLETLAIAGVAYSLPILFEIRMAPVLHDLVYGYAPRTDWSQNLRAGGYRPTAFMGHGLVVGFFMFLCTTAAMTLQKAGRKRLLGQPIWWVVVYLWVILLLCKAAAPIIYAAVGLTLVQYLSPRMQGRVLVGLGLIVLSYPITRILDVFPVQEILSLAGTLGPERVQSLQFRFDNEDILLLKGAERLWFGWGGYGRERVFDAETAKDLVIQDGQWIVVFGQSGLVGFLCYFALLLVPVWQLARGLKRIPGRADRTLLAGFGFAVVVCAVNMLPNMQLPYLQFMFAAGLIVLCSAMARPGSRAQARSVRQPRSASIRPARGAPLRPVWYGPPPVHAYVSSSSPGHTRSAHVHVTPPARAEAAASGVAQSNAVSAPAESSPRDGGSQRSPTPPDTLTPERSASVKTIAIRTLMERPAMRPPAPAPGADLSSPDLEASAAPQAAGSEACASQPVAADERSGVVSLQDAAAPVDAATRAQAPSAPAASPAAVTESAPLIAAGAGSAPAVCTASAEPAPLSAAAPKAGAAERVSAPAPVTAALAPSPSTPPGVPQCVPSAASSSMRAGVAAAESARPKAPHGAGTGARTASEQPQASSSVVPAAGRATHHSR